MSNRNDDHFTFAVTTGWAVFDVVYGRRASALKREGLGTPKRLQALIREYEVRRAQRAFDPEVEGVPDEEMQAIIDFHFGVVKPLVQKFTQSALGYWADEAWIDAAAVGGEPERHDEKRLYRAFYRFELLSCLFGDQQHLQGSEEGGGCRETQLAYDAFFAQFTPWEAEEINCVAQFVAETYGAALGASEADLYSDHLQLESLVSMGLCPLYDFCFQATSAADRAAMLERWGITQRFPIVYSGAGHAAHFREAGNDHALRARVLAEGAALPFQGDQGMNPDQIGQYPPLGWVTAWGGRQSDLVGRYVAPALRRWGYVFWEAERMEAGGAKALMEKHLAAFYGLPSVPM